jgi:hypothetical protein
MGQDDKGDFLMSKRKTKADYWAAIDVLYPKHQMTGIWIGVKDEAHGLCTDNEPSGNGNYGCKRCDAIVMLENRGRKIWPRVGR